MLLLSIESDLVASLKHDDIIDEFSRMKCRKVKPL